MKYFSFVKLNKDLNYLFSEIEKSFRWKFSKSLIKLHQIARNVLHNKVYFILYFVVPVVLNNIRMTQLL